MFLHRIHYRLVFLFVGFVVVVLSVSGWLLHWLLRQSLEAELGRKLVAVASAASVQLDEGEIGFLIQGAGPRTRQHLQQRLLRLKETTDVRRIYLFDLEGKSLLDTEEAAVSGGSYFGLRFYRREMAEIRRGRSTHSVLFEGVDGAPTMTGYAPLFLARGVVGGVGVDGSATFLAAVEGLRYRLYLIGLLGTLAAMALGIFMAGSITRPVGKLVGASERIGRGDYGDPIPTLGKGEIGLLAGTMEEMRKGVVERERELKAMLAGVAHEIRNPLGGIELFSGLLTDEVAEDTEARKHVDRISREVSHLKEIVNSFLAYARPQEPKREACRVGDAVEEVNLLLERQMEEQGVALSVSGGMNGVRAWIDPTHLKRVVINIFRNAIQAMPKGGEIRVRSEEEDARVFLYFEDTGEGIPEDVQPRIFTPFFTTRQMGTGLGLSIVKGLVEANGGSIRLVRSNRRGTAFVVALERFVDDKRSDG